MESHVTLDNLEPDAFAAVCGHLRHGEVAALAASCAALRHAVATNDRLWASLYQRQFPQPWARLTQRQASRPGQQQASSSGVVPGAWRDTFLRTHDACYQLASTDPQCREWTTDASAVHLAAIHGSGQERLTLTAQGSGVELRVAPEVSPDKSFQLYGHTARVSSAAVLHPAGFSAAAVQRIGVVTGSHDQTVRLWAGNCDPESWEFRSQTLSLLTPLRTLRGHQEAVTALQLMTSNTGVTIAATGSKDRTVRLWGLAPLVPSPVQKPGIATLRGHGAPITCLAIAGGSLDDSSSSSSSGGSSSRGSSSGSGNPASGSWLLSGSLDARVKQWDAFHGSCIGTAKCSMPVAACQPAAAAPELQPHTLLVSGGTQVQLLDLRCLRPVAGVAVPAERGEAVHCFCQWGWDLAVGSSDGARVIDIRQLHSLGSSSGAAAGSGAVPAGAGRGAPERLRIVGHARPVTSIHIDRLKVVTATDRYGPGPVRVWCADTGEPLAELESCLPPAQPPPSLEPDTQGAGWGGGNELEQQPGGAAAGVAAGPADGDEEDGGSPAAAAARRPAHQYHRGWEGVTALACQGALLVSGSSEGSVVERDFSRGGLPELEAGEAWSAGAALAGKFWASLG